MPRLVDFGEPENDLCHHQSLSDLIGHLESLLDREVDRIERTGGKLFGKGRLATRSDMVEEAIILLNKAAEID